MTISIIITISILLLLAYVFDITASKTKIPLALTFSFNLNITSFGLVKCSNTLLRKKINAQIRYIRVFLSILISNTNDKNKIVLTNYKVKYIKYKADYKPTQCNTSNSDSSVF